MKGPSLGFGLAGQSLHVHVRISQRFGLSVLVRGACRFNFLQRAKISGEPQMFARNSHRV